MKLLQRVLFFSKVRPPICAAVHAVLLSKKHGRSTEEARKKHRKGRHAPLLLLHKQAHDKRGIAESLHAQITRARLLVRWAYFREKYHNSRKYAHLPLLGAT